MVQEIQLHAVNVALHAGDAMVTHPIVHHVLLDHFYQTEQQVHVQHVVQIVEIVQDGHKPAHHVLLITHKVKEIIQIHAIHVEQLVITLQP
jgi:hypothetical protein